MERNLSHGQGQRAKALEGLHFKDRLINGQFHFSNCVFPDNEFRVEPIISLLLPTHFSEKGIFKPPLLHFEVSLDLQRPSHIDERKTELNCVKLINSGVIFFFVLSCLFSARSPRLFLSEELSFIFCISFILPLFSHYRCLSPILSLFFFSQPVFLLLTGAAFSQPSIQALLVGF